MVYVVIRDAGATCEIVRVISGELSLLEHTAQHVGSAAQLRPGDTSQARRFRRSVAAEDVVFAGVA